MMRVGRLAAAALTGSMAGGVLAAAVPPGTAAELSGYSEPTADQAGNVIIADGPPTGSG